MAGMHYYIINMPPDGAAAGSQFTVHTHVVLRVEVCRASAHKNVERLCKLPNERTPDGQQELER